LEIISPVVAACVPPLQPAVHAAPQPPNFFGSPPYTSPSLESLRALRI
jgi:hypothetical protein